MTDFLTNCISAYSCNGKPNLPFEENNGYSFAPFVEVKFTLNNELLTVGNNSRPNHGNGAAIKSMQYGASEGMGVTIEIVDEEGGQFTKSFEAINKGLGNIKENVRNFELDFGWIVVEEISGVSKLVSVSSVHGSPINMLPLKMNITYSEGVIKYTFEAQDMMSRVNETRQECAVGTDDHKIALKDAIRILAGTGQSPKFNVAFLKSDFETEWNFKNSGDTGGKGPLGFWTTCQQNKLEAIRRWIDDYVTENEKGIIFQYMTKKNFEKRIKNSFKKIGNFPIEEAVLVLLEDPSPDKCQPAFDYCQTNIATYIINGGNKSPVIEFNPSVVWTFAPNANEGGAAVPDSGEASKQEPKKECEEEKKTEGAGTTTAHVANPNAYPNSSAVDGVKANAAHQKANAFREFLSPIEAELKIMGDPFYTLPVEFMTKTLSLIVINPYHLKSKDNTGCGDWLSEPVCNPIFSNKNWMIMGVDHQIGEGSYFTTLKLKLPAPNSELGADAPIGNQKGAPIQDIKPELKQCSDI
jgi:hypothetical protein